MRDLAIYYMGWESERFEVWDEGGYVPYKGSSEVTEIDEEGD